MARKKSNARKIQPKPLREQIEKIIEPAKRHGAIAPHVPFDTVDEAMEDHVFILAERIRMMKELPPTDISTVENAQKAIPVLEEKLDEIKQLKQTADRLKALLSDD